MKIFSCSLLLVYLSLIVFSSACTSIINPVTTLPITDTASFEEPLEEEYLEALQRWKNHRIVDYEITVEVFSSFLSPACYMQAALIVKNETLVDIREIVTPEAIQLPNDKLISNPQCSEHERYQIAALLDLIKTTMHKQQPTGEYIREAEFDAEYGYVTYLYIIGGESVLEINTTNFVAK